MGNSRQVEFRITPSIRKKIVEIVDQRIREAHVTREDFSELKEIVKDLAIKVGSLAEAQQKTEQKVEQLAEAQKKTEQRIEELAELQKKTEERVEQLAEAQKKTEQRIEELAELQKKTEERVEQLAEAQKKTEQRVEELAEAQRQLAEAQRKTEEEVRKLAIGLQMTREELGGVGRTLGYAFENEAYRMLPRFLKATYGIEIKERLIRTDIGGKEINFFGRAERDGKEVFIVGEAKTRLDDKKKVEEALEDLAKKIEAVQKEYGEVEIVSLLVTHFATRTILNFIREKGIMVIQSYEW